VRTRDGQGSKIRDRYISDSKKHLESTSAEIAKLEVELEVAKEKESRLRASLELAERADRGVIEKKKASRECWSGRRRNGAD
jgi:protein kinase C substrate 80K-H